MNINNAEKEALFEALFAENGTRQPISMEDWKNGWFAITGENNGIPTSKQFNTLQNVSDLKCYLLYIQLLTMQEEIEKLKDMVDVGVIINPGGKLFVGDGSTEINGGDSLLIIDGMTATAGGFAYVGDTSIDITAGEILFINDDVLINRGGQVYVGNEDREIRLDSFQFVQD